MTQEIYQRLIDLGFELGTQKIRQRWDWDVLYQALKEFYEKKGPTAGVPKKYPLPGYAPSGLKHWVEKQRAQYKRKMDGLSHDLTEERIEKLRALEFNFAANGSRGDFDKIWADKLRRWHAFKVKYGHDPTREEDAALSAFVKDCRTKKNKLPKERRALANELGFDWNSY